jgi:hypothetical protein
MNTKEALSLAISVEAQDIINRHNLLGCSQWTPSQQKAYWVASCTGLVDHPETDWPEYADNALIRVITASGLTKSAFIECVLILSEQGGAL